MLLLLPNNPIVVFENILDFCGVDIVGAEFKLLALKLNNDIFN